MRVRGHGTIGMMVVYACALLLAVVGAGAVLVVRGAEIKAPEAIAVLIVASLVAQRSRIRVTSNVEQSLSLLPMLCAAVLFGALPAMVVGATSMLTDFRRPFLRWLVYSSGRSLNGFAVGSIATELGTHSGLGFARICVAAVVAALVAEAFDVLFAAITFRLRGNDPGALLASLIPLSATAVPIYGTMIALLVIAYHDVSAWTMPIFLFPAIGIQRLFILYQDQRSIADKLIDANESLRTASLSFAGALIAALDARDSYTAGHSAAVAVYARDIAIEMNLSKADQDLAYQCGLVHDIGKIGLPVGILEKAGPLSRDERVVMESHPVVGETMLRRIDEFADIATVVRHHHERFDGTGYPDGVVGMAIPLHARIIAVADAYNAMTSNRPYRDALPPSVALGRLQSDAKTQFDPDIVTAFERILFRETEPYRMGAIEHAFAHAWVVNGRLADDLPSFQVVARAVA